MVALGLGILDCSLRPQVALLSMDFGIQTLDFDSPVLGLNYLGTPSKTITGLFGIFSEMAKN